MIRHRRIARKLSSGKYMHHLPNKRIRNALIGQNLCDILLIELGSRDRETVAEVGPCSTLNLLVECRFVVRLEQLLCLFETALCHFVGLLITHTGNICVLLNLLAENNKEQYRYQCRYQITQPECECTEGYEGLATGIGR